MTYISIEDLPSYEEMMNDESIEDYTHFSDMINFKKIKTVKFSDPRIKKLNFSRAKDFYKFENAREAMLEADYGLSFILYKYMKIYNEIPRFLIIGNDTLAENFYDKLVEGLKIPQESLDFSHAYRNKKNVELTRFYFYMDKMILFFDGGSSYIIYPPEYYQDTDSPLYVLLGIIKAHKRPNIIKNTLYVVYRTDHGFQKKPFKVKKKNIDIQENYNKEFPRISEDIITKLNNKEKTGLVILHGEPGTGKTTYIRYLAGRLKRDIIFISPDMVHHITSPEFIPFLMDNSDAILIIEDAEPALQKRQGDSRSGAVSNILNMTDGLLSDCLNISIVATFNTNTNEIDHALRRQGRLLREYKFEKLEVDKAQNLMDKLGNKIEVKAPMSLAEIYFWGDKHSDDNFDKRKVGFGN